MTITIIDILTITILMILIGAIVFINITNFINKKLTDITVNIPPIEVPDPNITVKIQKTCNAENHNNSDSFSDNGFENQNYQIYVEKNNPKNYSISPIIETENNNIENFFIMDNKNAPSTLKGHNTGYFLTPPGRYCIDGEHVVQESTKVLQQTLDEQYNLVSPETIQMHPEMTNIIKNRKINKRFQNNAFTDLIKNDLETDDQFDQASKNYVRQLKNIDEDDIDPTEWFKKFQKFQPSYLEDLPTRGYNIESYTNISDVHNIGRIMLRDNHFKNAKPNGFIFQNSPINSQ